MKTQLISPFCPGSVLLNAIHLSYHFRQHHHTAFFNPIVPLSFPLSYHLRSTQFSPNNWYSAHSHFSHFSHLSHLSQNAHHSHFFPNHEVLENHEVLATEREPEGQAKRSKIAKQESAVRPVCGAEGIATFPKFPLFPKIPN